MKLIKKMCKISCAQQKIRLPRADSDMSLNNSIQYEHQMMQ